jgi:hypothetical protein
MYSRKPEGTCKKELQNFIVLYIILGNELNARK